MATQQTFEANIEEMKSRVMQMIRLQQEREDRSNIHTASTIWSDALGVFDYLLNLSPSNFRNIRYHTGLITGETFKYWHQFPPYDPQAFAEKLGYTFFTRALPGEYWIGEPPIPTLPGEMGVDYQGCVINKNILRYQSCIANLHTMGILSRLHNCESHPLVLEIGGGYGGLAHAFGQVAPGTTYFVVDLPGMLLFSGGYLILNNPDKNIYVYEPDSFQRMITNNEFMHYDFVLLPHYILDELYGLPSIDLMINMMSFQEMTAEQIHSYLKWGRQKVSGFFYSDNMDRHPLNPALDEKAVTDYLAEDFQLLPSPDFYDSIPDKLPHWFYKCYLGQSKDHEPSFPVDGTLKLILRLSEGRRYVTLACHSEGGEFHVDAEEETAVFV